jgi:hypothetical protein
MKRRSKRKQKAGSKRASTRTKSKFFELRTVEQFFALPEADRDFWTDVGHIATEVKGGVSLSQSARKYRRDPRKVRKAAPAAFRKLKNGRYAAKTNDHILRVLHIPTRKGLREIGVRDSGQASLLGRYWTAVEQHRDTGDASALREFRGKYIIDTNGKQHRLLTDLSTLDRLGSAGLLSFETLYARAA